MKNKNCKGIAFIITKPIQLLTALAILKDQSLTYKVTIYFCNSFNEAFKVESRFAFANNYKIHTVRSENRIHAINLAAKKKTDILYIDSDVGVQHFFSLLKFKLRNPCSSINVFEEGYGTYNVNSYTGLTKFILKNFGVGSSFGSSVFTKNIYLYDANEYVAKYEDQSHKVISIKTSIWELIDIERILLYKTFDVNIDIKSLGCYKKKNCYIYMTNYEIEYSLLSKFMLIGAPLFIKYHPHIKSPPLIDGLQVLNTSTPVEVILKVLLQIFEKIIIYDHNSAARRYVSDPRIEFKTIYELCKQPMSFH